MIESWSNFYLLIGSAAAALIGLLFVVTTLTAGRDRSSVERGTRLFTSPIVFHLALIVVLSGAAMAPTLSAKAFGLIGAVGAAVGAVAAVRIATGIHRAPPGLTVEWFDTGWYGIAPAALYLLLLGSSAAVATGRPWGATAVAAVLMGVLLVSIHNAWDLVTFLAPKADAGPGAGGGAEEPRAPDH